MTIWIYTDKDGVRREERFTIEQMMADGEVLSAFSSMESNVADGEPAETLKHDAPIVRKIESLPPNRAEHWRAELRRIGTKVELSPKTQAQVAALKAEVVKNTGGSK